MNQPADPATDPRDPRRSRRAALALGAGTLLLGLAPLAARGKDGDDNVLNEASVLRDPEIPVAGNADGNITIVEYFDYQCPYCRKVESELRQAVSEDGKVRLVYKDWPILGPVSVYASKLALATKFQGKFIEAHDALIGLDVRLTEPGIRERLGNAGIDVERATKDLEANQQAIAAVLKRTNDQATAFGFQGTPAFIIGKFRVPGPLTRQQFTQAISDARKALAKKQ